MSLALYLDDCAFSRRLRTLLETAGHSVQTPFDVEPPIAGANDEAHFKHAISAGRAILTYNAKDFLQLHKATREHFGILAVYQDNDPKRDMTYAGIVRAIGNLERLEETLRGGFYVLNAYRR